MDGSVHYNVGLYIVESFFSPCWWWWEDEADVWVVAGVVGVVAGVAVVAATALLVDDDAWLGPGATTAHTETWTAQNNRI